MLPGVDVTITPVEYMHASYAGFLRMTMVVLKGWKETHGSKRDTAYDRHVVGAVAEFVVSKCLQRYWPGPGKIGDADLGGNIDVRVSAYGGPDPLLVIYENDPDDRPFVLVAAGANPLRYTVVGWLTGREGKQDRFYGELVPGRPAYRVPIGELHPVYDLKDVV